MATKDITVKLKVGDSSHPDGWFEAYPSVFNNVDSYKDMVLKGAFTQTLLDWANSGQQIPVLFGHNMSDPDFNLGEVLTAVEDDHGLRITGQLDLSNPKSMQTYRLMKGGRINQLSFAYDVEESAWVESEELGFYQELRKLKLYEVSIVTIGANQATEILAVKSGKTLSAKSEQKVVSALGKADLALKSINDAIAELKSLIEAAGVDESPAPAAEESTTKAAPASEKEPVKAEELPTEAKAQEPTPVTPADVAKSAQMQMQIKLLAL